MLVEQARGEGEGPPDSPTRVKTRLEVQLSMNMTQMFRLNAKSELDIRIGRPNLGISSSMGSQPSNTGTRHAARTAHTCTRGGCDQNDRTWGSGEQYLTVQRNDKKRTGAK
jgi:hypothetical protein